MPGNNEKRQIFNSMLNKIQVKSGYQYQIMRILKGTRSQIQNFSRGSSNGSS